MIRNLIKRCLPERMVEALRYVRYGRLTGDEAPRQEPGLMGMTTIDEQRYYTKCAQETFDIDGAIVDLGSWLGSTAMSLARGVRSKQEKHSAGTAKIYSFDRFIWESGMDMMLPHVACDYKPGETFFPEARRRIREYRDNIELTQVDLSNYEWKGGPIKILLVDAMKNWQLTRSIATSFYPFLKLHSLLIHQDFKHWGTPWIHILQYRLRDHFVFTHDVIDGCTVAFETVRQVSLEDAIRASQFDDISDAEVEAAIAYSTALVCNEGKSAIAAAHLMYFVHRSRPRKAREMLAFYSSAHLPPTPDFSIAMKHVEGMDG